MKTIRFNLAIFIIGITLLSCETNKLISVMVIDNQTRQPIDSILVEISAGKNGDYTKSGAKGYTNSKGEFKTHIMIGCAFGCYDIYTNYSKSGYIKKIDLNKTEGLIELEK